MRDGSSIGVGDSMTKRNWVSLPADSTVKRTRTRGSPGHSPDQISSPAVPSTT